MSKPNGTKVIAALLAAAAAWLGSAEAQLQDAHASKLSAVRDHLAATSQQADWTELTKSCERAVALEGIVVDSGAEALRIELSLSGEAPYRLRFDGSSNQLHIDLAGTVVLPETQSLLLASGGLVSGTAASLQSVSPAMLSRATIALTAPVAVESAYQDGKLVVRAERADAFTQSAADTAAQESAMLAALLDATASADASSLMIAAKDCSANIATLQTALADAKVRLLEYEFSGLNSDAESANAASGLVSKVDAMAAELDRLSAAQASTITERDAVRAAAREHCSAVDMANVEAVISAFDSATSQISAAEIASAQRLRALAAAAADRTEAVTTLAREVAALSGADESATVFASLDGALGEYRSDAASENVLASLDTVMAQVAVSAPEFDLGAPVMAAVKKGSVDTEQTLSAAPARRATAQDYDSALTTNAFGNVSFVQNGQETVQLAQSMEAREDISFSAPRSPAFQLYRPGVPADQDPLQQPVTIDFRDMDLLNVVSLLAEKGEINVIAGTEVRGTVTASLQDIPLGRAIETILRMNGLGIVEEAGVYRITTYEEAVESRRETKIIFLQNVKAKEIEKTIDQTLRGPDASRFQVAANEDTNTIVLSGPADLVNQMAAVVQKMDVTEQAIPTVTKVFKLNHAVPKDIEKIIDDILTNEGEVNSDNRSRQLVVTDTPGKIRDIEDLVLELDGAVKQVAIEATVVDVVMDDNAQTGIDWLIERLPDGNVQSGLLANAFAPTGGAAAALTLLTGDFNIDLLLVGEIRNNNAEILANPVVVTVENSPARISIAEEIPFRDDLQTEAGGTVSSTAFKEIGTILEVTPRITHDNEIVVTLSVKQSSISGFTPAPENIPIEDLREVDSTLRINDGQTVFIGGLRKFQDSVNSTKMPILGNIPVLGVLFGNRSVVQDHIELLVFITCNVMNTLPELTPYQQEWYDEVGGREMRPDGERVLVESYIDPEIYRDPFYKWRRDK